MVHQLKVREEYFEALVSGKKTFEVRKNDRNFKVGDFLALNEFDGLATTGRTILFNVSYILDNTEFLQDGYVCLAITPCNVVQCVKPVILKGCDF